MWAHDSNINESAVAPVFPRTQDMNEETSGSKAGSVPGGMRRLYLKLSRHRPCQHVKFRSAHPGASCDSQHN